MAARHYRELIAWQRAMDMVTEVYQLTKGFPRDEIYGLVSQVRRAAVSVPSNIAEGQGRGIGSSFANHLRIAGGTLQEVETQMLIAERLGYVNESELLQLMDTCCEVGRLVNGLLRSITQNEP